MLIRAITLAMQRRYKLHCSVIAMLMSLVITCINVSAFAQNIAPGASTPRFTQPQEGQSSTPFSQAFSRQQDKSTTLPSTADASLAEPVGAGDLAYGAYQRGRFISAFKAATARVENNPDDAAAMTLLGELYAQGAGVAPDPAKAADWYRLATAKGDINAYFRLSIALIKGEGVGKDEMRGRNLLTKAADAGHALAAYNLALLLLSSDNKADAPLAATTMRKAADADMPEAQYALGIMLREGRGIDVDKAAAATLFARAAKNSDIPAQVEHAIMLFNGDGIPKNEALAAQGFRRAAFRGNAIAQNRLARLYIAGRGVTRDVVEAAAWHLIAAGQGLDDAWLDAALANLTPEERTRAQGIALRRLPV
jgi:uncharacterized protein